MFACSCLARGSYVLFKSDCLPQVCRGQYHAYTLSSLLLYYDSLSCAQNRRQHHSTPFACVAHAVGTHQRTVCARRALLVVAALLRCRHAEHTKNSKTNETHNKCNISNYDIFSMIRQRNNYVHLVILLAAGSSPPPIPAVGQLHHDYTQECELPDYVRLRVQRCATTPCVVAREPLYRGFCSTDKVYKGFYATTSTTAVLYNRTRSTY